MRMPEEPGLRGTRFDAVVVNPPRRGVAPAVVAYVSCDPETLARDLDHLSRLGYASARVRPCCNHGCRRAPGVRRRWR
jgi:tRNA/tmRNA/rRNA uracil-C5-methylase (TrmA/RlmC/RlmD family)